MFPVALQDMAIRRRFPKFTYRRENGIPTWRGVLSPRESSPEYRLVIRYRAGKPPQVNVTKPHLHPDAPHRYEDGSLCLYWPKEWPWSDEQIIAKTILPWIALWLFYYELWLDTRKWVGPQAPHQPPRRPLTKKVRDSSTKGCNRFNLCDDPTFPT